MGLALALAARGLGNTWPNPAVGCVIVSSDGFIVGRGWTAPGGRPHAEVIALGQAGGDARGGTAYVTLEPCSHFGQTSPCANSLIEAGIARCVISVSDPDPRVDGRGISILRRAGIKVQTGLLAAFSTELNAGFFARVQCGRPIFTLKLATSLDGKIATSSGESHWITGSSSRLLVHRLRAEHDAVLVGSGTVLADNPDLRCRLPGFDPRPVTRVILDGRLRIPEESRLLSLPQEAPVVVITSRHADAGRIEMIRCRGAEVVCLDSLAPILIAQALGSLGITRVLLEGGGAVVASFLEAGLIDRVVWFQAPVVFGANGVNGVGSLALSRLADAHKFVCRSIQSCGKDAVMFLEADTQLCKSDP